MEFSELVSDFAQRHAVSGLAAEDGAAALDIDGIPVTLVEAADHLAATAEIGEPPAEGRADFAEILLEANLESGAFFAKTRESGKYVLVRRLPLAGLDSDAFDTALEGLVNIAETWRRLLADFRPAAKAAAEATSAAPAFGTSGFLQV
jgi:hypothetical protein